jgi:adenylyltransferase/sulfurtransferase
MNLSPEEKLRYERHLSLPNVGLEGQLRLKNSRVLIVGVGGLGSPASLYLAAAGVGQIGLVDPDRVSVSNLQRQILYSSHQLRTSKVHSAKHRLESLNPYPQIETYDTAITSKNALELISKYDVIIDGTDQFSTRYLIQDACFLSQKPYVYGAIYRFDAQVSVFFPPRGPCYRCLYPEPPQGISMDCNEAGVLGVLPGIIGTLQATETLKMLLNLGTPLMGRLLTLDVLEMDFRSIQMTPHPGCILCGPNPKITSLEEQNYSQTSCMQSPLKSSQLVDVRTWAEFQTGHLEGAIHIPLQDLKDRLQDLNPSLDTLIYCQTGLRSEQAVNLLRSSGFKEVNHIQGGLSKFLLSR